MSEIGEVSLTQVRLVLEESCPGTTVFSVANTRSGYTSRQWLAETDKGALLVKAPTRLRDPEHSRHLIAATRLAHEAGLPTTRFRSFTPDSEVIGGPVLVQEFIDATAANDLWDTFTTEDKFKIIGDLGALIATLHNRSGAWFGDVLGTGQWQNWGSYLTNHMTRLLDGAPAGVIPRALPDIRERFTAAIDVVADGATPALTHGDVWLDNVLLRGTSISCVLDFEHARFADPLYDFSKPDELVFERWPQGRAAFLNGYSKVRDLPEDYERRIVVYRGFHYLFMLLWFAQWQQELVPEYQERLENWSRDLAVVLAR